MPWLFSSLSECIFAINAFMRKYLKKRKLISALFLIVTLTILWQKNSQNIHEWLLESYLGVVSPVDQLVQKFELTVFRREYGENEFINIERFHKWDVPIRVRLNGDEPKRFQTHVKGTLRTLSRLSGVSIRMKNEDDKEQANMDFYITYPEQALSIVMSEGWIENESTWLIESNCFFALNLEVGTTPHALIGIKMPQSDSMIKHCIIKEITQGLGLIADTDILQPSIMSDDIPLIDRLPMNDKIMVRTLYDKRLKSGMTRDEAMPIVRKIIPELVAAVQERGEEALYQ